MTHEEKLKKVTADIRVKLPRLMELEKGCLVDAEHTGRWEIIYCDFTGEKAIYYAINEFLEIVELSQGDIVKIIGKEPQFADVIEWLSDVEVKDKKINDSLDISLFYGKDFRLKTCKNEVRWDLSKPHLKDQSEELVNFLFELTSN